MTLVSKNISLPISPTLGRTCFSQGMKISFQAAAVNSTPPACSSFPQRYTALLHCTLNLLLLICQNKASAFLENSGFSSCSEQTDCLVCLQRSFNKCPCPRHIIGRFVYARQGAASSGITDFSQLLPASSHWQWPTGGSHLPCKRWEDCRKT